MSEIFTIQKGADRPSVRVAVTEAGAAVDLTGATVAFRMKTRGTDALKVSDAAGSLVGAGSLGVVQYDWASADTDAAGTYDAHFRITLPGSHLLIAPSKGSIEVVVEA